MPSSEDLRTELATESLGAYRHLREAAFHLIKNGGAAATPEVLSLLHDAADIHSAVADFAMRGSRYSTQLAHLCKTIGGACADALEPHTNEDATLRVAYAACRQTGQFCDAYLDALRDGNDADDKLHEALLETFPASDPVPPPTEI